MTAAPQRAGSDRGRRRTRSSTGSYGRVLGRELQLVQAAVEPARARSSSSWVPTSRISPPSSTTMRSASRTVAEAVGDDEGRPALHQVGEGLLHQPLGLGVERGGGLVEDEDGRVLEQGARDGDALPLPAGEPAPPLADHGVVAARQVEDEVVGEGRARRRLDARLVHVVEAVGDVGAHGVVEEHRLLGHEADLLAQARERDLADVHAVDE